VSIGRDAAPQAPPRPIPIRFPNQVSSKRQISRIFID
jgi:hypothetical protein